jgi:hypothetical protein
MAGLIFLSIFLLGLIMLAGLIVGIVGLATSKGKMTAGGFISFGIALILMICTIVYGVRKAVGKVRDLSETMKGMDTLGTYGDYESSPDVTEDVRTYLLDDSSTNVTMKYIREASGKKDLFIRESYYTYFGTSSESRFPVIYPFAIHCWDTKDYGTLVNEEQVEDIRYQPGKEENVVFNIHGFAYDDKYILLKTATVQGDPNSSVYMLYDMNKKMSETFDSEEKLMKAAKKTGYSGATELISLWDYDKKF